MDSNQVAKLSWPLACIIDPCRICRLTFLWCALAHLALPLRFYRCSCSSSVMLPPLKMLPPSTLEANKCALKIVLFFSVFYFNFFLKLLFPLSSSLCLTVFICLQHFHIEDFTLTLLNLCSNSLINYMFFLTIQLKK